MKKKTRFAFNAYLQQLARLNGVAVEELSSKFTVEPSVQQTLEDQIQQSAAFLTLINVTPVTEQSGQLLGLGVGSTIAGTTDTTAKEREPVDPTLMVDVEYKCEQTNFDTVLTYAKLDLWAKFQDFQVRIRDAIVKRQALDRIMIGFNGVKRAKTSNRSENPLLQDVNKGWLQKIREDAPDHVMGSTTTGGETTPGAVKVGKGGEYANLDAVVMDAVNELIDVVYQDDDDLVVICGRELLSDKYFPLVNKEQENSEKLAADMIISQKRMGGLQAVRAPFFPPNALLITRLDNLSIYWQEDKRCLVGAVLAIAATLPGFQQLHTSVEGLKLIADYEGCRLQPYQCSAGVWTDGIGNTSGVIPGKTITERQAAEGLISNVLRVERALERCVKQQPPQKVYDAAVSFAFNVGTGNACSSTLVKLLNQRRWADACRQLPRWVYVKGVFNQGLDNRRAREMAWCLQGAN
ncbi:hypothetical protein ESCOCK413M_13345 [Escherichia coli]|nr:phage major capsid protein, P2 family [Escherichia coli]HCJ9861046.1 phage major capsid protein, P2 family [Escherichia coli]